MPPISRRDFLSIATRSLLGLSGALGLAGLVRFLSYEPTPPPPQKFEIGKAENYPFDSRTTLPEIPALLIHSREGFSAISLICTHLGCTVEAKSDSFACPCHGSLYDVEGAVTKGPASQALQKLKVELLPDGKLVVYKD